MAQRWSSTAALPDLSSDGSFCLASPWGHALGRGTGSGRGALGWWQGRGGAGQDQVSQCLSPVLGGRAGPGGFSSWWSHRVVL